MNTHVLTALLSCVLACQREANNIPTPSVEVEVTTPAKYESRPKPPKVILKYDAYDGPLVVSNSSGVFLLDARGAIQAKISDKPGLDPRWLRPGESVLVLRPSTGNDQPRTLALVEIDIAARKERVIASDLIGDTVKCPSGSVNEYGQELEDQLLDDLGVQDEEHFGASAERGLACVWLMDRNFNMHALAVEAKINLSDGAVARTQLRAGHCTPSPEWIDDDPECLSLKLSVASREWRDEELASMGPYHVGDGALWRREGKTDERIAGPFSERIDPESEEPIGLASFEPLNLSPSGRWAVLLGNQQWGDYLHADWLLLDTQTGEIFAVTGPTWPAPLSIEALGQLDADVVNNDTTPEDTLVWLSDDRLVVQRWLVLPGEAVIELPGQLAR